MTAGGATELLDGGFQIGRRSGFVHHVAVDKISSTNETAVGQQVDAVAIGYPNDRQHTFIGLAAP